MTAVLTLMLVAATAVVPADSAPPRRNPGFLRAAELLGRRSPGEAPRVRFEWELVPGATAYLLSGAWTDIRSWTVQTREHRVGPKQAASWRPSGVAFEVSLPAGAHSWRVVALFGPRDAGDFANPRQLSFDLR